MCFNNLQVSKALLGRCICSLQHIATCSLLPKWHRQEKRVEKGLPFCNEADMGAGDVLQQLEGLYLIVFLVN